MNNAAEEIVLNSSTFKTILDMSNDTAKIQEINRAAEKILDIDYDLVYDFFSSKFKVADEYEYIIVKVRRDFILAQVFCAILLFDTKSDVRLKYELAANILRSDIFVSSPDFVRWETYIPNKTKVQNKCDETDNYVVKTRNARVLVLDDIIIHGRALSQLVDYLINVGLYNLVNVDADSIIVCKDAECINNNLEACLVDKYKKKSARQEYGVTPESWKSLSNKFVEIIQHSGQSYAAFIDSYMVPVDYNCEDALPHYVPELCSSAQKKANIKLKVYYKKDEFKDNMLKHCLRYYTQKLENDLVRRIAIPFVELPFISLQEWRGMYSQISVFKNVKHIKNNGGTHGSVDIFSYKLVSNIASNYFAKELDLVEATSNNLLYSFNLNVTDNVEILKEAYIVYSNLKKANNNMVSESTDDVIGFCTQRVKHLESVKLWKNLVSKTQKAKITTEDLNAMMTKYLAKLNAINEERAKMKEPRLQGMPIASLFEVLRYYSDKYNWNLEPETYWAFYAYIISLWDVGIANYNVDIFKYEGKEYIGGCITDGEQAYHAIMEPMCALEVYILHLIRSYTTNLSDFMKVLNLVIEQNSIEGSWINIENLQAVRKYYRDNQTLNELMHAYPATEEERQKLSQYIRSMI